MFRFLDRCCWAESLCVTIIIFLQKVGLDVYCSFNGGQVVKGDRSHFQQSLRKVKCLQSSRFHNLRRTDWRADYQMQQLRFKLKQAKVKIPLKESKQLLQVDQMQELYIRPQRLICPECGRIRQHLLPVQPIYCLPPPNKGDQLFRSIGPQYEIIFWM